MVIVTRRQFVIAESIKHVGITEDIEELRKNGKWTSRNVYKIEIEYVPENSANLNRSSGTMTCAIRCYSQKIAENMFIDIVHQYREQNPDKLYLDKIAEKWLKI